MKPHDDEMTPLRWVALAALVASCGDPGSYVIGTLPTGGGSGQMMVVDSDGGVGGGTGVIGGGSAGTGGGTACDCVVSGSTLTMSWECYRTRFFVDRAPGPTCSNYVDSSKACGLTLVAFFGPQTTIVRDGTGTAVGGQSVTDLSDYVCPDDVSLHAPVARGGVFPDASCSVTTCSCSSGDIVCP